MQAAEENCNSNCNNIFRKNKKMLLSYNKNQEKRIVREQKDLFVVKNMITKVKVFYWWIKM